MLEQTRDAVVVGCADLVSGSAGLCARVDGLSAAGAATEIALERLREGCKLGRSILPVGRDS